MRINLKVDMDIQLVDIIGVQREWETRHQIRALARNGKSRVVLDLEDLKKKHPDDYKKIMKIVKLVAENERVDNKNYVKQGDKHKEVYEIRGGQARLFFFYTPDNKQIVVCTNHYWKAKDSKAEQDAEFERCDQFRMAYLNAQKLDSLEKGKK